MTNIITLPKIHQDPVSRMRDKINHTASALRQLRLLMHYIEQYVEYGTVKHDMSNLRQLEEDLIKENEYYHREFERLQK